MAFPSTLENPLTSIPILHTFPSQVKEAQIAQSVERVLGKDEVTGSNPVLGSISSTNRHADTLPDRG